MDKTTQQERFKYMREDILNMSQTNLAETLKVKQQTIADIESGRKQKIDTEILYILNKDLGIHIEWLLFGEGSPNSLEDEEEKQHNLKNIVAIPFYNAKAAAGNGEAAPEYEEKDYMYFDRRWLENVIGVNPKQLSIIQASGDSMEPLIHNSDLLLIDKSDISGRNGVYVFRQDSSDLRVKRFSRDFNGNLQIISENPKYPIETLDNTTQSFLIEIIGKVVWNGSKENV